MLPFLFGKGQGEIPEALPEHPCYALLAAETIDGWRLSAPLPPMNYGGVQSFKRQLAGERTLQELGQTAVLEPE